MNWVKQVKAKHSALMVELFREAFCWLPLCHVLNKKVLVVHGGLFSRDAISLDDLRSIDRNRCKTVPLQLNSAMLLSGDVRFHSPAGGRNKGH